MRRILLATIASLLLVASPASAMMIQTPLVVESDVEHAQVGDDVLFSIHPQNRSEADRYGGRTLRAEYRYDATEDGREAGHGAVGNATLAADATGSFRWTVPAEANATNVWITLFDGEDVVGTAHLPVGDAPPIMFALGGGPADSGPVDEPAAQSSGARTVPFAGIGLLVAAAVGVALLVRRHG